MTYFMSSGTQNLDLVNFALFMSLLRKRRHNFK